MVTWKFVMRERGGRCFGAVDEVGARGQWRMPCFGGLDLNFQTCRDFWSTCALCQKSVGEKRVERGVDVTVVVRPSRAAGRWTTAVCYSLFV